MRVSWGVHPTSMSRSPPSPQHPEPPHTQHPHAPPHLIYSEPFALQQTTTNPNIKYLLIYPFIVCIFFFSKGRRGRLLLIHLSIALTPLNLPTCVWSVGTVGGLFMPDISSSTQQINLLPRLASSCPRPRTLLFDFHKSMSGLAYTSTGKKVIKAAREVNAAAPVPLRNPLALLFSGRGLGNGARDEEEAAAIEEDARAAKIRGGTL